MSELADISFEAGTVNDGLNVGVNAKSVIASISENSKQASVSTNVVSLTDVATNAAVEVAVGNEATAAEGTVVVSSEAAVDVPQVVDAKADKHVKVLEDLEAKKAAALQKVADKFAEKEFKAKQKLVSLSVRRQVAHDLIEGMRNEVRAHVGKPYLEDDAVDKLITAAFTTGLATVAV